MNENEFDVLAKRLEDPEIISRKKTDPIAKFLDSLIWPKSWPLGRYTFVRELVALNTPSRLTLLGFILAFPAAWFFQMAETAVSMYTLYGALCYAVGMSCDFFDGNLARYQDDLHKPKKYTEDEEYAFSFWRRVNLIGTTHFGNIFDAFKDKVIYYLALFSTGWSVVWHPFMYFSFGVALILTVIRIRWIRNKLALGGKNSSKLPGKIKVNVEVGAIAAIVLLPVFLPMFDLPPYGAVHYWSSNILVGISLLFGLASLSVHFWLGFRKVQAKVKAVRAKSKDRHMKRKASRSLR